MNSGEANVGGQAVIEGVMMRSEKFISTAVRRPDGKIALRRQQHESWGKRFKPFKTPFIRGGAILIESLIHGIKALSWSADIAIEEETGEYKPRENNWKSTLGTAMTMIVAFGIGLLLFFWIPLVLTDMIGVESGFAFNAIDGAIRLAMFGAYILLISLWKEIRRVFEYHGAEHKSIFALENDYPLTIDGAKEFTTLHPRCGTSFLLIVMVVSIIVFMFLGKPDGTSERLVRLLFVPVIGGISYELIRLSGKLRNNKIAGFFIKPGLWLQKITTKEPDESQLEVGLVALRSALGETLNEDNIIHYNENGEIIDSELMENPVPNSSPAV